MVGLLSPSSRIELLRVNRIGCLGTSSPTIRSFFLDMVLKLKRRATGAVAVVDNLDGLPLSGSVSSDE